MLNIAILGAGAISDSHINAYLKIRNRATRCRAGRSVPGKGRREGRPARIAGEGLRELRRAARRLRLRRRLDLPAALRARTGGRGDAPRGQTCPHRKADAPTCLEECDQMLDAARASGRVLGIVAQNRFKTPMMKLKRVLDSGIIGKVLPRPGRFVLVAGRQLLRSLVARDLGQGGRRLHHEPRRPPYRSVPLDDGPAQ